MSRLYIRVKTGFYTHRKTAKLRGLIGDDAFWIPPRLWAYAAENQPNGDMSDYSSIALALLLGCSKHESSIREHLISSGYLDPDGKIHDWEEHNGYHQAFSRRATVAATARWEKKREAEKKTDDQRKKEESGDKHCLIDAPSMKPLFSAPSIEEVKLFAEKAGLPVLEAEKFFNHYESNGWMVGRHKMKKLASAVAGWKLRWQENEQNKPAKRYANLCARIALHPAHRDNAGHGSPPPTPEQIAEFRRLCEQRDATPEYQRQ